MRHNNTNYSFLVFKHLILHPFNNILLEPNDRSGTDLNLLWETAFFHMGINKSFPNTRHLNNLREPEKPRCKCVLSQGNR